MKNPDITTRIKHSETKSAWDICGLKLGGKYKIAIVPYIISEDADVTATQKAEAFQHAEYINWCFNNSEVIIDAMKHRI